MQPEESDHQCSHFAALGGWISDYAARFLWYTARAPADRLTFLPSVRCPTCGANLMRAALNRADHLALAQVQTTPAT